MAQKCVICGADISTPDYYATIRRKYCRTCAADIKRRQKADWQKEYRRKNRERNAVTRKLCETQQQAIDALNAEMIRLREQVRRLEGSQ